MSGRVGRNPRLFKNLWGIFISMVLFIFPWKIRRILLNYFLSFKIHKDAKIGFSIVIPDS